MCVCNKHRDAESHICLCKLKCVDFQFLGLHFSGGAAKEIIMTVACLG